MTQTAPGGEGAPPEAPAPPRLSTRPTLLGLAIACPVVETALLWRFHELTSLGLAPQVTAPAPFDTFHDLRWLLVFHRSWPTLALELVAFLVFRTTMNTLLLRAAWPRDRPRPSLASSVAHTATFTFVVAVLLLPWADLLFGMAVVSISWLFLVALPCALIVAVLVHHGVVGRGWWRHAPPLRTVGWIVLTFAVLTASGGILTTCPAALRLPVAAAAGLFNAWAWLGVVHATVVRERTARFVPLAPIGLVALVGVVIGGMLIGFGVVTSKARINRAHHTARATGAATGRPVLVVAGFGTTWRGGTRDVLGGAFHERHFSYRGVDGHDHPLPYSSADTHRSLDDLARLMAVQVDAFAREVGQPIDIVAESEGALVAKVYVTAARHPPVDRLVLLSPLVEPARVYYPPHGQSGWGIAAARAVEGVTEVLRATSPLSLTPDTQLFRSIVDHAPALRHVLSCPVDGVRELAMFPLADAVVAPGPVTLGIPVVVVPAFHGGLLGDAAAHKTIELVLSGRHVPVSSAWSTTERVIRAAASPWQVPELPLSLNPAWGPPHTRAPSCAQMADALHAWAGPRATAT